MTSVVTEAVHRARKFFGIEDFPGNIFSLLEKENYIGEYGLLLFCGGEYWLVTNDKGNVYKHPDINIFDTYAGDPDVIILTGREWLAQSGYTEEG